MKVVSYAPDAWRLLNGIFCVYKPPRVLSIHVRNSLAVCLCRDLNDMETRHAKDLVKIEGSIASGKSLSVKLVPNFADNTAVVGPRYQPQDIRLKWVTHLGRNTSGVFLMAVNDSCIKSRAIHDANVLRTVEVKGEFGLATDTFMRDGKVIEKATYGHIKRTFLDKLLTSIQASHQADSFAYSGIDVESQEAFEVASKGIVRPYGKSPPILYKITCTEFKLPHFTLEFVCVNETEEFLCEIIHQIGIYLKSCAVCCQLRQLQYGNFTLDHALLRKHWTLEHILGNIIICKDLADVSEILPSGHFQPKSRNEVQEPLRNLQKDKRESNLLYTDV